MDNASKNATDMISRLQMQYNRGRQAAITNELVDIITGKLSVFKYVSCFETKATLQVPALSRVERKILLDHIICSFYLKTNKKNL
jgi:hypothetical protein